MRLSSLYICYLPVSEPLVETQVIAYLRGLATDHDIYLLTFETERLSKEVREAITSRLAQDGITWYAARYHKHFSILATAWDTTAGIVRGWSIARRHHIDLVHARIHVPGAMALALRRILGLAILFDVRGLMAEEYVDAGRWKEGGLAFRMVRWVERRIVVQAAGVVVLTRKAKALLLERYEIDGSNFEVIPSCSDVGQLRRDPAKREALRDRLGWQDRLVIVYVGKFSGWYMAREMARFFAVASAADKQVSLLVLTQSDRALIEQELLSLGCDPSRFYIDRVSPAEVGDYLAAADFGISFIRPSPSKIASSPTKIGEYLAAGLPVVTTAGIGDVEEQISKHSCGVVIDRHTDDVYLDAFCKIRELISQADISERCSATAEEELSLERVGIPRYRRLYRAIAESSDR